MSKQFKGKIELDVRDSVAELRLASAHVPVLDLLRRGGIADRVRIEQTVDGAVADSGLTPLGGGALLQG